MRYRTRLAKARFLNVQRVRVVWCELLNDEGEWGAINLLMSTNTQLSTEEVIQNHGMRWRIETMFNRLKLAWDLKEA